MIGDSYKSDVAGPSQAGIKGIHLLREAESGGDPGSISSLHDILKTVF